MQQQQQQRPRSGNRQQWHEQEKTNEFKGTNPSDSASHNNRYGDTNKTLISDVIALYDFAKKLLMR